MGALKLIDYEAKNPLKVVYSKTLKERKSVQRFLSTDPNAQYYSPYVGMGNNPVSRVDPDGGFDKGGGPEKPAPVGSPANPIQLSSVVVTAVRTSYHNFVNFSNDALKYISQSLSRGDYWITHLYNNNDTQPGGERYYANTGIPHSSNENKLNAIATKHITFGGDYTDFFELASQPGDAVDLVNKGLYSYNLVTLDVKEISIKIAESNTNVHPDTKYYVDPIRNDTLNSTDATKRNSNNFSGWTTIPAWQYNYYHNQK